MSIQYSLGGLSFSRAGTGTFSERVPDGAEAREALAAEWRACERGTVELVVFTERYAAVPEKLFDPQALPDYLYARNIVCGKGETILTSAADGIVHVFTMEEEFLAWLRSFAGEPVVVHALQRMAGTVSAAGLKKGELLALSLCGGHVCYSFYRNRILAAMDCLAGNDYNRLMALLPLLQDHLGTKRAWVLFDDNGDLGAVAGKVFRKTEKLSPEEYRNGGAKR